MTNRHFGSSGGNYHSRNHIKKPCSCSLMNLRLKEINSGYRRDRTLINESYHEGTRCWVRLSFDIIRLILGILDLLNDRYASIYLFKFTTIMLWSRHICFEG